MADSQINGLDDRTLALADFFPSQGASGAGGRSRISDVKDLIAAGKKKIVFRIALNNLTVTVMESDFTSGVTFTMSNPANGAIVITASSSIFPSSKTFVKSFSYNNGGSPYIVTGLGNGFDINLLFFLHDGTHTSTPNFTDYFVEVVVYP